MPSASSIDHRNAPLNPCSLESLPEPVETMDRRKVWLVIVSCYELQADGRRSGHMDLFSVQVPVLPTDSLAFGPPHTVESGDSGILDGKWFPKYEAERKEWWYATARSSGELCIHTIQLNDDVRSSFPFTTKPFQARARLDDTSSISTSEVAEDRGSDGRTPPLCLALNWDTSSVSDSATSIVSSYSNGMVAIHNVIRCEADGTPIIIERDSWFAHSLFGNTPAEVWSCGFADRGKMVISGGDDGKVKFWDIRSTMKPIKILQDFEAGVTAISPHPRKEYLVAIGSYDETIAIYDLRYMSQKLMNRSESVGGGIWRIQWHPTNDDRLLLAAMHGGCRVLDLTWSVDRPSFNVMTYFTEHESMAYGADWLVQEHGVETAASCSFYDRATFLWDTK